MAEPGKKQTRRSRVSLVAPAAGGQNFGLHRVPDFRIFCASGSAFGPFPGLSDSQTGRSPGKSPTFSHLDFTWQDSSRSSGRVSGGVRQKGIERISSRRLIKESPARFKTKPWPILKRASRADFAERTENRNFKKAERREKMAGEGIAGFSIVEKRT